MLADCLNTFMSGCGFNFDIRFHHKALSRMPLPSFFRQKQALSRYLFCFCSIQFLPELIFPLKAMSGPLIFSFWEQKKSNLLVHLDAKFLIYIKMTRLTGSSKMRWQLHVNYIQGFIMIWRIILGRKFLWYKQRLKQDKMAVNSNK